MSNMVIHADAPSTQKWIDRGFYKEEITLTKAHEKIIAQ